jgi:hypothetical protein
MRSRIARLRLQSCVLPVPPSSLTASFWLPESSRIASTCGATRAASSTDSGPVTWTTCTIEIPGSALFRSRYVPSVRWSHIWIVFVLQNRCCSMMSATLCRDVSKNVPTAGGTVAAISAICSSLMTPGPLGMCETRPSADAPHSTAKAASSTLLMQQIFTRGVRDAGMRFPLCFPPCTSVSSVVKKIFTTEITEVHRGSPTHHMEPIYFLPGWRAQGTSVPRPVSD